MWTYEQFVEELKSKLDISVPDVPEEPETKPKKRSYLGREDAIDLYGDVQLYSDSGYAEPWNKEQALVLSWKTGGIDGGSCWGGENHAYSTHEPEPQWDCLDRILEHFAPNITFIRYKRIMRLTTTADFTRYEYYGNSSSYALRILKLKDLWKHMCDNKLFEIGTDNE